MKWNKNTSKTLAYTVLLLSVFAFSTYPTSHSKYIDTKPNLISFNSKFYELYQANKATISLKEDTSNLQTAQFSISFPRNKVGDFKEKDVYEIIIKDPSGTTIPSNKCTIIGGNTKTYQKNSSSSNVSVVMSCPKVEDVPKVIIGGVEFFNFSVEIKEKFDKEEQFVYTDGRFTYSYPVYKEKYEPKEEVPKELVIQSNESDKYNKFMDWINKTFSASNTQNQKILAYLNENIGTTDDDIWNLALPGVKVKKGTDPTTGIETHVYSISENMPGYAQMDPDQSSTFMYFTTADKEELETAFEFYLKKHYCVSNEDDTGCTLDQDSYDLVVEYVKSFDGTGISYMILKDENNQYRTIPGLERMTTGDENRHKINIAPTIVDYAYNKKYKGKIRISFNNKADMWALFTVGITDVYDETIASKDLVALDEQAGVFGIISTNAQIRASVITNTIDSTEDIKSFNNYFIVYDDTNKHNLLIHVYSNAADNQTDPYNYAEIAILDENNMKNVTTANISLTAKAKEDIIRTINELDKGFNQTTTIDESKLVPNGLGIITYNYTLPVVVTD